MPDTEGGNQADKYIPDLISKWLPLESKQVSQESETHSMICIHLQEYSSGK